MSERNLSGATWRKSSYSGNTGNCVEIAATESGVAVRDSKVPDSGVLVMSREEWRGLLATVKKTRLV
jgi:hypothetical protein